MASIYHNRFNLTISAGLCILLMASSLAVMAQEVLCRIEMRPTAAVAGQMVRLKDVAHIWAPDKDQQEKLEQVEIVRSPLAGRTQLIWREQIERRLKQLGMPQEQWQLTSTGPTKVVRHTVPLSADKIRAAVKRHIQNHAPWQADQLSIRAVKFNRNLQIPPGKVSMDVHTPKHSDWLGAVLFGVNVKVDGRLVQKIDVPANIEVWSNVVLAAKPLGKYQPINSNVLKVERMNLARVPANAILNPEEIIGQRTKRSIAVNAVLRSDQIERRPLVKRGDRVLAIAESPAVKISVQVVAKEEGAKGEIIRVRNLRSKKIIYAEVLDAQTVSVSF